MILFLVAFMAVPLRDGFCSISTQTDRAHYCSDPHWECSYHGDNHAFWSMPWLQKVRPGESIFFAPFETLICSLSQWREFCVAIPSP